MVQTVAVFADGLTIYNENKIINIKWKVCTYNGCLCKCGIPTELHAKVKTTKFVRKRLMVLFFLSLHPRIFPANYTE